MLTFLQFKTAVRTRIFPSGESRNLRPAHDKSIVDALVDVQRWVDCLQNNNTFMAPHCATFYNCGLTSFDFPRGRIKHLSVVDKAVVTDLSSTSNGSGGSGGSGGGSSGSGIAAGTVVETETVSITWQPENWSGDYSDKPPIVYRNGTLYTATQDGNFVVDVIQRSSCSPYIQTHVPQYIRTEITYTDPDDVAHTLQIGSQLYLEVAQSAGTATIAVKSGTAITYKVSYFNTPFTDCGGSVDFTVTAAATNVTVSAAGNTASVVNTSDTSSSASTASGDWCNEIEYTQVEPCQIHSYLKASHNCGHCMPISDFFAIPSCFCGNKTTAAIPTDEGVDPTLAPLPLGYRYPQASTDSPYGRALAGIWAIENGRIYVAPWIESTEMIVVKWEGIKRDWVDADLVDDDPGLFRAVEMWLRWEHARDWDSDLNKAQAYEIEYRKALAELIYDCEEENRVRACEPGHARGIAPADVDRFTTDDPPPPVPPIPPTVVQYMNTVAGVGAATCESLWDGVAPHPTPFVSTITVPVGTVPGTYVAEANQIAQDTAQALAVAGLTGKCQFWNKAMPATATCPTGTTGASITVTEPASQHSSYDSQGAANQLAYVEAKNDANAALAASGNCTGPALVVYWNTRQYSRLTSWCVTMGCQVTIEWYVPAGVISSIVNQGTADVEALQLTQAAGAGVTAAQMCADPTVDCGINYRNVNSLSGPL